MKKLILIAAALSFVGLATAASFTPSHPLSHIHPTDTDFNMSDYRIFNASELSVRDGFTFDDFTVYQDQTNVPILNYRESNASWVINNSNIDMNQNLIYDYWGDNCNAVDVVVTKIHPNGTYDCGAIDEAADDLYVNQDGDNMSGNLQMNQNEIRNVSNFTNFFEDSCETGQVVDRVYENGSYSCANVTDSQEYAQNLSEVLDIGNRAEGFNINMTEQNITELDSLLFDDTQARIYNQQNSFEIESGTANELNLVTDGSQVASLTATGGTQEILLKRQLLLEDRDGDTLADLSRDGPITFYNSVNGNPVLRMNNSGGSNVEVPSGNLDMEGNNITDISNLYRDDSSTSFFEDACGEFRAVQGIYPNGTYKCTEEILEEETESLNETLNAGNIANRSIYMNGNNFILQGSYLTNDTDDDGIRIDDSGRVGVNTLPENNIGLKTGGPAKLNSALELANTVDGSTNSISFISDSNAIINGRESFTDSANSIKLENPNQAPIIFETDSTERFRISGSGQLDSRNDLNLSDNDLQLDGSLQFYEGGNVTASTGAEDNIVIQDEDGERAIAVDRDGVVDIAQNDLNLSENKIDNVRRIDLENGNENAYIEELSSGELAINSEGNILRLQDSYATEISAESNLRLNENDIEQVDQISFNDTDSSGSDFVVREENNGDFVIEEGGTDRIRAGTDNISIPNDNIDLNSNNITDVSNIFEDDSSTNFFDAACGEFRALKGIYPNGSFICTEKILEEKTEYLNETLEAGNYAGDNDIYMNQSQILDIGTGRTNFTADGGLNMSGRIQMNNLDVENIREINSNGNNLAVGASQTDFNDNEIDNVSKIGVKTDNPDENLDVEGSANISSSGTSMNVKDNGNVVVTLG